MATCRDGESRGEIGCSWRAVYWRASCCWDVAMCPVRLAFDRGTLRIDGAEAPGLPHVRFDDRTGFHRAPAHHYVAIREACVEGAIVIDDQVAPEAFAPPIAPASPELRPYQAQALAAFERFGSRGVVALPTGSGKTRVACAAIARAKSSAAVLVPTRALLEQWVTILEGLFDGPIGAVGDGANRVEPITVMTFESAYRRLDVHGHRFGMIVVDEVHHFGGGLRAEALEMSAAPRRLGLTATPPTSGSIAAARLRDLAA
jgi:superfamily II DNA or RNA helicase